MSKTGPDSGPIDVGDTVADPTRTVASRDKTIAPSSAGFNDSLDGARFAPGTLLAGRYRLIAMLGRGGMGEVYRAEDLKLGEAVALKFLPEHLSLDAAALARFHREVRIARQIAHRNVCRVHDIGGAEGYHFLTMEYIDGEDLSTLLRRIGRLPQNKAVELAGQICRGLAAAHDAGVLHRDLKPANIMIDGKGRAKITDFGLANLQDELRDSEQDHFAGTPAYMAPEQLRGGELTARSDIYALGLVLYEMFTGEKAFPDEDWRRLVARGSREAPPTEPSSHVEGLDPQIERGLLRCLEEDPKDRPRSALEVAAALPGGDPLRAALEAGETPSPEMVAGVSERAVLSVRAGVLWLVGFAMAVGLVQLSSGRLTLLGMVNPEKHPRVLEDKASTLLSELGWPESGGTQIADRFGAYRQEEDRTGGFDGASLKAWQTRSRERPAFLTYVFRTSATGLYEEGIGTPTADQPPARPGDSLVVLDPSGRLDALRLDPVGTAPAGEPDWSRLFTWAELDPADFEPVDVPPYQGGDDLPAHEVRASWTGRLDGRDVRVDAASFGSLPVYFRLYEPTSAEVAPPSHGFSPWLLVGFFAVLAVALFVAVRNVRRGRGDIRGAVALGSFLAMVAVTTQAIASHHAGGIFELRLLMNILGSAAFRGATALLLYLAMEPVVRSRCPELIVSWTRLLRGRWSDSLVSRDLLVGFSVSMMVFVGMLITAWFRSSEPWSIYGLGNKLGGLRGMLGYVDPFAQVAGTLTIAMTFAWVQSFTRRRWLTGLLLIVVVMLLSKNFFGPVLIVGLLAGVGALAAVAAWFTMDLIAFFPAAADPSAWWAWPNAWLFPALLLIVAILAFRNATGLGSAAPLRGGS